MSTQALGVYWENINATYIAWIWCKTPLSLRIVSANKWSGSISQRPINDVVAIDAQRGETVASRCSTHYVNNFQFVCLIIFDWSIAKDRLISTNYREYKIPKYLPFSEVTWESSASESRDAVNRSDCHCDEKRRTFLKTAILRKWFQCPLPLTSLELASYELCLLPIRFPTRTGRDRCGSPSEASAKRFATGSIRHIASECLPPFLVRHFVSPYFTEMSLLSYGERAFFTDRVRMEGGGKRFFFFFVCFFFSFFFLRDDR